MINPNTLLLDEEIAILRDSKDWKNYLAILSIWAQITLGFVIFSVSPSLLTFIVAALIIGTRQFALVVMMHDCAHNLISKNKKIKHSDYSENELIALIQKRLLELGCNAGIVDGIWGNVVMLQQ